MSSSLVDISDKERAIAGRIDNAIATGLAVGERGGIRFVNASQVMDFAKVMAVANIGVRKHLRGNAGACLAVCVQAVEWGMSPYAVANKSYLVNDQIAFESQLVQAVILMRAPIRGRIKFEFSGQGPTLQCRAWARLRDEEDEIVEYVSPQFKDIAVKNSPLWKADPEQQFSYYAGRALCRRHFPDILLGVYTPEEFTNGVPMVDATAAPKEALAPAPRTMSSRLDALAASGGAQEQDVDGGGSEHGDDGVVIDHEAGHESDADASDDDDGEQAPTQPQQTQASAPEQPQDPERTALMHKLRGKAQKGRSALRLAFGNLVPAENERLSSDDRKYLEDVADDAEREKAGAS